MSLLCSRSCGSPVFRWPAHLLAFRFHLPTSTVACLARASLIHLFSCPPPLPRRHHITSPIPHASCGFLVSGLGPHSHLHLLLPASLYDSSSLSVVACGPGLADLLLKLLLTHPPVRRQLSVAPDVSLAGRPSRSHSAHTTPTPMSSFRFSSLLTTSLVASLFTRECVLRSSAPTPPASFLAQFRQRLDQQH